MSATVKGARFLQVSAEVRYWEDATVNGVEDTHGTLIPFRSGDLWLPIIDIAEGRVVSWPYGMVASVHYKVCDAGEYWLLNAKTERIAKYASEYVPDRLLCHGDRGYGDYIILDIDGDSRIKNWRTPVIDESEWVSTDAPATGGEG